MVVSSDCQKRLSTHLSVTSASKILAFTYTRGHWSSHPSSLCITRQHFCTVSIVGIINLHLIRPTLWCALIWNKVLTPLAVGDVVSFLESSPCINSKTHYKLCVAPIICIANISLSGFGLKILFQSYLTFTQCNHIDNFFLEINMIAGMFENWCDFPPHFLRKCVVLIS